MNALIPSRSFGTAKRAAACVVAGMLALACLSGCANLGGGSSNSSGIDGLGPVDDRPAADALADKLDGADVVGTVVDFDEGGFTLRPTQGDEQTALIPLEDVGTDRTVPFAANPTVSIATFDRNAGTSSEAPGTLADVKIDSAVHVWLDDAGAAREIVVFRVA